MSSQVGTIIIGGFLLEKEAVAVELGGQPCEASRILTFPLSKASPSGCRSYFIRVPYIVCLQMYRAFT
jgi:hypothetical protein